MDAIKQIIKNEYGILQDSDGLTYHGICEKYHPNWGGFKVVRHVMSLYDGDYNRINSELDSNIWLQNKVVNFYQTNYIDVLRGSLMPDMIRYQVGDCAVNLGVKTAIKMLQSVLGVVQDGIIGSVTLGAIIEHKDHYRLVTEFNLQRSMYYCEGVRRKRFKKYGRGWINRVNFNNQLAVKYYR